MTAALDYDDLALRMSHGNDDFYQVARLALLEKPATTERQAFYTIRHAIAEERAHTQYPVKLSLSTVTRARNGSNDAAAEAMLPALDPDLASPERGYIDGGYSVVDTRVTTAQLLATLPPEDRSALWRRFIDGKTHGARDRQRIERLCATLRATANNPHAQPWSHNAAA